MSQLREIGVNVSATAGSVALVRGNLASARANAAAGRAVNVAAIRNNTAAIRVNAANLVELAANVTNNTIAINTCDDTVKVAPNQFSYIGQLPNGRGKQTTRGIASGNQKRYGTISCSHHCNDIFDGRTGHWGPDGSTYRAANVSVPPMGFAPATPNTRQTTSCPYGPRAGLGRNLVPVSGYPLLGVVPRGVGQHVYWCCSTDLAVPTVLTGAPLWWNVMLCWRATCFLCDILGSGQGTQR